MSFLRCGAGLALVALLLAPARAAEPGAPPVPPTEYEVKAAFLFNFAKFIEWPAATAHQEFVIGVLGEDPFGETLDRVLRGKSLGDRKIVLRRGATLEELGDVRVLFIASSEKARLGPILKRVQDSPTLTVGDTEDFVGRGGMVAFRVQDDVVRFDVNLEPLGRAGLKMSSQLIRVARRVVSPSGS
jgi:hypothetical protein